MSAIKIPGCSKPLALEPCEAAWPPLRGLVKRHWSTASVELNEWWTATVSDEMFAAVYECALRDAVWTLLPNAILMRHRPDELWIAPNERGGSVTGGIAPTPLHAWRAAAQYLKVGPWGTD